MHHQLPTPSKQPTHRSNLTNLLGRIITLGASLALMINCTPRGNSTSSSRSLDNAETTITPHSGDASTLSAIELIPLIREAQNTALELSRKSELITSMLSGTSYSSACALSLQVKEIKITLKGHIAGDTTAAIEDPSNHHQMPTGSAEGNTSRLLWTFGDTGGGIFSRYAKNYASFGQPYTTNWDDPPFTLRDIRRIKVSQDNHLFGNKSWVLKEITVKASSKDFTIYENDSLNETFSSGHAWTVSYDELLKNKAYKELLEQKDCA